MRIWIDTEFNGYDGKLISLALVDEEGRSFYHYTYCSDPTAWIAEHVLPVLRTFRPQPLDTQKAVEHPSDVWTLPHIRRALEQWLTRYDRLHIVAAWPEEICQLCRVLITGPGARLNATPLTMEVRRDLDVESLVPHNALEDARARRAVHLAYEKAGCL